MCRVLIIFLILNFYSPVYSSKKEEIISQMKLTKNLSFSFIQTINNKNEEIRRAISVLVSQGLVKHNINAIGIIAND